MGIVVKNRGMLSSYLQKNLIKLVKFVEI